MLTQVRLANDRRLVTAGLSLLLIPAIWYVQTDFQLYANDWPRLRERLLVRALMILTPIAGIIAMRVIRTRATYARATFSIAIALMAWIVLINFMRPAGSGLPLRSPLLTLAVVYFAMPNTVWRQLTPAVVFSGALILLRLTKLGGGGADVGGDLVAIISMNAVGVLALLRRTGLERETDDTIAQLRTLHGIIPICAHCRKLKSEVGDWQMLEQYMQNHSDAKFSHGICPSCLEEHYAEWMPKSPAPAK